MKIQSRADADRQPIHAGYERLFRQCERLDERRRSRHVLRAGHGIGQEVGHVVASRKAARRSKKDDHADRVVVIGLFQRGRHPLIHAGGDGILLFGPVEADHEDAVAVIRVLNEDMAFAHDALLQAKMAWEASRLAAPETTRSFRVAVSASRFSAANRHSATRFSRLPSPISARAPLAR